MNITILVDSRFRGKDRLCYVIITERRVAASKPVLSEVEGPQALGMVANLKVRSKKRQKNNVLIFDSSFIIIDKFNIGPRRQSSFTI